MTNVSEHETAQTVTPLRRRPGRLTVAIGDRAPRARPGAGAGGTVRALTGALAPHLSTADPELHDLAATLLSAQQAYAAGATVAPSADGDRVCQQYFEAARDYCTALERRGLAPPPGLLEAEHWLAERADR
ncbi:hypothetical protein [Cryptosporangium minutisporangium]|uniref:Uncharacterized protein n=1 Tax=Cryptosporangium minutisporangium TaxID=113569 RepID=A0ABP6T0Q7_9ACTN